MIQASNWPQQGKGASLSRRELQIARSYGGGRSYREIARELLIAPETVRSHIRTIYRKLDISSKVELLDRLRSNSSAADKSNQLCSAIAAPGTATVAVLPPRYLSCDSSTTPLARAIHEDLLAELSRYRSHSLIAHKSFLSRQLSDEDPIGKFRQMGADFVIDSRLRKIADKLRFTFFLIETDSRRFRWAQRYDRCPSTILSDHDELIREVVATIMAHIGCVDHGGIFAEALEAASEAIVVYDADGRLVTCNRNFRHLYGYSDEETRPGVHFAELGQLDVARGQVVVGDEYSGGDAYLQRKADYRRKLEGSFIVRLKDGRWLKTTDRPMTGGGFVSVQVDVTGIK